jgi:DnaK suppressor protein
MDITTPTDATLTPSSAPGEVNEQIDAACDVCGAPIGAERLEALPGTKRCVLCAAGRQAMR